MQSARAFATATTLTTGRVLVTGGVDGDYNYLATAELFDPTSLRFTPVGAMNAARAGHSATLLGSGQVLIAGGSVCNAGKCEQLASAELYDPILQQFVPVAPMHTARTDHTATLLFDGSVLVTGGMGDGALAGAEIFDPVSDRFLDAGSMTSARFFHASTLLTDGEVLISGGRGCVQCSKTALLDSVEVYDPSRRQFFAAGQILRSRMQHTSTLLRDGRVLIAGGRICAGDCEADRALDDAEIYDPGTNTSIAGGPMTVARAAHQAFAMTDGTIFIFGGQHCSPSLFCDNGDSGEIFEPDILKFSQAIEGIPAVDDLVSAPLSNERILIAGGRNSGAILKRAYVLSFGP